MDFNQTQLPNVESLSSGVLTNSDEDLYEPLLAQLHRPKLEVQKTQR